MKSNIPQCERCLIGQMLLMDWRFTTMGICRHVPAWDPVRPLPSGWHMRCMVCAAKWLSKQALAKDAIHIEQDLIGENVGSQDQVSAAYGGFNRIDFYRDDSFDVAPVILPAQRLEDLRDHLLLCFTGLSSHRRQGREIPDRQLQKSRNRTQTHARNGR